MKHTTVSFRPTALRLESLDAALVSLEYKTAFPDPVRRTLGDGQS